MVRKKRALINFTTSQLQNQNEANYIKTVSLLAQRNLEQKVYFNTLVNEHRPNKNLKKNGP